MTFAKHNRGRRLKTLSAPMQIETMESRLLLTAPTVLAPTGTIATANPQIVWNAVEQPGTGDSPVSYDLWVSSRESFETLFVKMGDDAVTDTMYTPNASETLPVGDIRAWVRANFEDGSQSPWSPGHDFRIEVTPTVTGPVGASPNNVILDTTPTVTWSTPPGSTRFQVFIRDDTAVAGRMYTVENTPDEIREFTVPDDEALLFGSYTAWVRSINPSGNDIDDPSSRISPWSEPLKFNVGPTVKIVSPLGPTFDGTPTLRWNALERATDYEVFLISKADHEAGGQPPLIRTTVTGTSLELGALIESGELAGLDSDTYLFWVRAVNNTEGQAPVFGAWGSPAEFTTPVQAPVVTVPSAVPRDGQNDLVTAANPIIEWDAIDGAARYEIWINQSNAREPFIRESAVSNSHQLETSLPEGTFFVWVRAISTRGEFSDWSEVVVFDTSGGQPVITSPTQGEVIDGFDTTFTWLPTEGAQSYDIWVDYTGVDFTFITPVTPDTPNGTGGGIQGTSYTVPSPLGPGNYRVWVRAMFADGTTSPWSSAVSFEVGVPMAQAGKAPSPALTRINVDLVATDQTPDAEPQQSATSPDESYVTRNDVAVAQAETEVPAHASSNDAVSAGATPTQTSPGEAPLPEHVLARLAANCVAGEWWDVSTIEA